MSEDDCYIAILVKLNVLAMSWPEFSELPSCVDCSGVEYPCTQLLSSLHVLSCLITQYMYVQLQPIKTYKLSTIINNYQPSNFSILEPFTSIICIAGWLLQVSNHPRVELV